MGRRRLPTPAAPDGAIRQVFEQMLAEVLPGIRREARILARKISGAIAHEDLAQIGAEAAWRALLRPGSSDRAAVKGFCLWKAGRVMVDAFQAEHVHERHHGDLPEDMEPANDCDVSHATERRELLERVCSQVDRLPDLEREVMRLLYAAHRSQGEAAAAMGLAQSRVCALHPGGVKTVRVALGEPA